MFLFPLLIGFIGLIAMVALGALGGGHSHGGGGHAGHLGGHAGGHLGAGHGHALGQTHAVSHGHVAAQGHAQPLAAKSGQPRDLRLREGSSVSSVVLNTLSPITIFSLCLGFGASGIILGTMLAFPTLIYAAVVGAMLFTFGAVKPLMGWLAGFASTPSVGTEGMVNQEAEAITRFDKEGRGIVQLTLDGQNVQLLATLDLLEVEHGVQVNKGERLLVTEVDSAKNTCRVSRDLAI